MTLCHSPWLYNLFFSLNDLKEIKENFTSGKEDDLILKRPFQGHCMHAFGAGIVPSRQKLGGMIFVKYINYDIYIYVFFYNIASLID